MTRTVLTALLALLSHWRRHRLQLLTCIGGLAIATALWSGVQAINAEARASYDAAASTLSEGQFDQLLPRANDTIALGTYVALRRNGWLVSPVIEGRLNGVRLIGLDPLTSPHGLSGVQLDEDVPLPDFLGGGAIFATREAAAQLDTELPVEVSPNLAPGIAVTDIGIAQDLLGQRGLTRLIVIETQPANRPRLSEIAPQLRLLPTQQTADLGEMTASFHLNLTAFGLLSFAVGIFIVHSTIGLAFEQRRAMIRTLRALGVSLRAVIVATVIEMVILAMFGATIGIALGYIIAAALLPDVAATLRGLYGADVTGTLQLRADWWLSGFAIAFAGTAVAATGKLWQIASMPILAGGRAQAWAVRTCRARGLQVLAAALLLVGALLLAQFGTGLVAGFTMLGCMLLGAAMALPAFLDSAVRFLEARSQAVKPQWFWADTRQQIPALSLALMALLLAIAANIGVSTMVSSFRVTFIGFLDQRLAPELYVFVEEAEASSAVEAALVANADEVLPLYARRENVEGQLVEIEGIRVGRTYRDNWRFVAAESNVWEQLQRGKAVIANEQFARRVDLWVGDRVQLAGEPRRLAGIVSDYGNPMGQITLGEGFYNALYAEDRALRFGARTADPAALQNMVQSTTGLPDSAFVDQREIRSFSIEVFDRTFTVTGALNILTLTIAAFAMLTSLLTLAELRLPQLAPAWALGLTRRELSRLEMLRTLALAAMVCVLALPLGLALAWVLLNIINVEAFGWRLPMFLFPWDYARLSVLALISAFLATLWPAVRLLRIAPNMLLKVFANES
ncbi:MAG: ABC transporter permease [Pseudomonadota bacterium]